MPRKINLFNQYEEPSKCFLTPSNSILAKKNKIQEGLNIGQFEESKIEKCLTNEFFQSTRGETVFLSYLPKTAQYCPIRHNITLTSLPKINQNRKIKGI